MTAVLVIDMSDMDRTDLTQQLRDAMSESVASARPSFSAGDIRRRHRRHRRLVTIVSVATAVVVLLGAIAVRASLHGLSAPRPVSPGRTSRYVDRSFGWGIRYPRGWVFAPLHGGPIADLGPDLDGFRLTNFVPDLKLDTRGVSGPSAGLSIDITGWLKAFPASGVAVQLLLAQQLASSSLHDSAFPLSAASFRRAGRHAGGSEPRPLSRTFYGDGLEFAVAVWAGPRASGADVRAAWAVVRSLRFAALTTGTTWQGQYYVLGPVTRYPVGSVTAVPAASLPKIGGGQQPYGIYLVHAPRGFYVIGMNFQAASIICSVAFDPRSRQFFCPGQRWRWDILGLPVGPASAQPPLPNPYDRALLLQQATVAQDGHVLYDTAGNENITEPAQQAMRYWWG